MPVLSAAETYTVTTVRASHHLCVKTLCSHALPASNFWTPSNHWISLYQSLCLEVLEFLKNLRVRVFENLLNLLVLDLLLTEMIEADYLF